MYLIPWEYYRLEGIGRKMQRTPIEIDGEKQHGGLCNMDRTSRAILTAFTGQFDCDIGVAHVSFGIHSAQANGTPKDILQPLVQYRNNTFSSFDSHSFPLHSPA